MPIRCPRQHNFPSCDSIMRRFRQARADSSSRHFAHICGLTTKRFSKPIKNPNRSYQMPAKGLTITTNMHTIYVSVPRGLCVIVIPSRLAVRFRTTIPIVLYYMAWYAVPAVTSSRSNSLKRMSSCLMHGRVYLGRDYRNLSAMVVWYRLRFGFSICVDLEGITWAEELCH